MKIPFDTYLGMESTAHRILQTGSKGSCKKEDRVLPRVATDYWEKKVTFFFPGWSQQIFPYAVKIIIIDISIHVQYRYLQA